MHDISTAIVLGVHSFAAPHRKTGIQYIAEGLARRGVAVDYISVPSSAFDILGRERRSRMARVWPRMGCSPVFHSAGQLREFAFVSPVPVHRLFVRGEGMLRVVRSLAPKGIFAQQYDLCIHDVGPTMAYLPLVRANRFVLRLNDVPQELDGMPAPLIWSLTSNLAQRFYNRVWAVSEPLAAFARQAAPGTPVESFANGVDRELFQDVEDRAGQESGTRAVYLGSRTPWLDVALIRQVADLLPGWEFHCLGAGFEKESDTANLRFLPPVPHVAVPELLAGYDVGLLPYRDHGAHMDHVSRPLKFYEYVAAGLGVACVHVGGLRQGVGDWACFGRTSEEFAAAVVESGRAARAVSHEKRAVFLAENAWSVRLGQMLGTLG